MRVNRFFLAIGLLTKTTATIWGLVCSQVDIHGVGTDTTNAVLGLIIAFNQICRA